MPAAKAGGSPLSGRRVLVTRAKEQADGLAELLRSRGATPVSGAAISIQPLADLSELDAAIGRLNGYSWVIFTSANGVMHFFDRLRVVRGDENLGAVKVCAIGPATARAVEEREVTVDYVPAEYVAEAVVAGLKARGVEGSRILLPRALEAREVIVAELVAAGAVVDDIPVYVTVQPDSDKENVSNALRRGEIDILTFASSSSVRNLVALLDGDISILRGLTVACIGPITAQTATELGLTVQVVASEHTVAGLVDAIVDYELEKTV